jgi:hypothetical protein
MGGRVVEHIERALGGMGETPEAVAEAVRAAGVRGLRGSTSSLNPVVRYLNRTVDIGGRLEVGAGGTVLQLQRGNKVYEAVRPPPVRAFLEGFHLGLYPDPDGA